MCMVFVTIDKQWWDKNSEKFLKRFKEQYEGEEKPGYLIDTDEDKLFDQYDDYSWSDNDDKGNQIFSRDNQGLYVSFKTIINEDQLKDILINKPELIPVAIEVITKKFNQVKSLLETAKAL